MLKTATRAEHDATEAVMPAIGPGLTRAQYVGVLSGMYRAVAGWDAWAAENAPEDLRELVAARRRSPALVRDLRFFGQEPPVPEIPVAAAVASQSKVAERAAFLGMMYVVEGSTLGGQWIAREVEPLLGLAPGEGDAFFRGYGSETGVRWKEFRALLAAVPEELGPVMVDSALRMFGFFRHCLAEATAPVEAAAGR